MLMGDCERDISAAEFNLTYNHFVFTQRTLVKLALMKQMILDRKKELKQNTHSLYCNTKNKYTRRNNGYE